ncbi:MAG: propionyl-CoA synthetase [Granulosicoccaceae bacterium]
MTETFDAVYSRSIENPQQFWGDLAKDVHWHKSPQKVLDDSNSPFNHWFPDGELNACYNALDLHVEQGNGDRTALIYDSPVTDTVRRYSFSEMRDEVAKLAGALRDQGVSAGDRVLIYMPMIPQATMAMLACARIGAVHSVVFGGFAANELAVRIDDAQPVAILAASCGIEGARVVEYKPLLDEAIELSSHKPSACFILQRPQAQASMLDGRDLDWESTTAAASPADCVPMPANAPLYVLYTSGTTGQPKGVVRDTGGYVVALKWSMGAIYGVQPGDVFWAASDVGWVVGHSYICYGPLFNGNTTVMFEGKPVGTPDPGAFWRVIADHKVKVLFTAPTAFRAIKKEDPNGEYIGKYDLSSLEALYLAGERCDPDTLEWAQTKLQLPVIDHWWQTETGWSIAANCRGIELLPVVPGSPTRPAPGYEMDVLDSEGQPVEAGDIGALVVKLPLPPGTFPTLWNAPDRYVSSYFSAYPGYYETGDAGYIDENGYVFVMARTDDVINVAGHRLSTGGIEEALAGHPDVAECAVMGVADQLKGQLPVGLLVLSDGCNRPHEEIVKECVQRVRDQIGPVAAFKIATVVTRLPKTRSGKILRATMRSIADGADWKMPATIDDPAILAEIGESLKALGYPKA